MVIRSKRRVLPKKKSVGKTKKKAVANRSKKAKISRLDILEESGLIGCLSGTGVTSKNYKDALFKK